MYYECCSVILRHKVTQAGWHAFYINLSIFNLALSAGAVEYTDCISAEV